MSSTGLWGYHGVPVLTSLQFRGRQDTEEVAESIRHPLCTSAYGGRVRKRQGQLERENLKAGTAIFYNLILVLMYCCFYYVLLVIQTIPGRVWEGPTKGIDWRFLGIMLEAAYPTSLQGCCA